jgi:hypothetical protein
VALKHIITQGSFLEIFLEGPVTTRIVDIQLKQHRLCAVPTTWLCPVCLQHLCADKEFKPQDICVNNRRCGINTLMMLTVFKVSYLNCIPYDCVRRLIHVIMEALNCLM